MSDSSSPHRKRWPAAVRALAHRNFQIYFAGQGVSTLGKWVQQVALAWLAYHLTGSAVLLGLITFLSLAPQLLIGPLAGAWIDRHDKRRLLIIVQLILIAQSLVLALATWRNWIDGPFIAAMALLLGLLNALETPLRQALIGSFVDDPADLPNALVLNAMLINAARFVGPPLAGGLIALAGEAACFALTAVAFMALLGGLLKVRGTAGPKASGSTAQVFREGLLYLWQTRNVRQLLVNVIMVNLLASCYAALLPILARAVFAGDARVLGWLWGAAGAGAFVATLVLAVGGALPRLCQFTDAGALHQQVAGDLEHEVAEEEQAGCPAEHRRGKAQVLVHADGGEADIGAVEVADHVADEDERHQAPQHAAHQAFALGVAERRLGSGGFVGHVVTLL